MSYLSEIQSGHKLVINRDEFKPSGPDEPFEGPLCYREMYRHPRNINPRKLNPSLGFNERMGVDRAIHESAVKTRREVERRVPAKCDSCPSLKVSTSVEHSFSEDAIRIQTVAQCSLAPRCSRVVIKSIPDLSYDQYGRSTQYFDHLGRRTVDYAMPAGPVKPKNGDLPAVAPDFDGVQW